MSEQIETVETQAAAIKCTAPSQCSAEATFTLVNAKSRVVLGFNCDSHIAPLISKRDDYDKIALPASGADLPGWYTNWVSK